MKRLAFLLLGCGLLALLSSNSYVYTNEHIADDGPRRAEVLFLGNTSTHHNSGKYAPWINIPLFARGVNITYSVDTNDLNAENLAKYDALIIYANYDKISAAKSKALQDFVEGGKGLVPIHSASACFTNSAWYIKAVGGQFKEHGTGVFKATTINSTHPVMQGVKEFSSWDESYVHSNLNPDMTILQERVSGTSREPWTWVRNQGKGRVFYTAGGHNDSTWLQPDFIKLVGNGVIWALGDKVGSQVAALRPPVLRYDDTIVVPNYERRNPPPKFQYALSPQQSMELMQVPVDFEVKLFAAEPDITNPIAMSWDERGRLWVVESVDYPNTFLETDGAANDRIKICEDTNGDGKADKFTIFADKLNIPTSMVFANGGVVVSMAPDFIFLKDTNGDDKADVREKILTGWGKYDTHAGPSNLIYGFDNKIWGVVGYSGFNGLADGKPLRFAQGVYRLDPDGKNMEFLANATNNTWGLGQTEENHTFVSTANNIHSAYYSMPYTYMQRPLPSAVVLAADQAVPQQPQGAGGGRGAAQISIPLQNIQGHADLHTLTPNLRQVDVFGGFTAAAGHHFYTARNFPREYWNRIAFVNEPTARLVHRAVIERSGAGFREKDGWNFLASSDEWVGPVHAEVGPDGAVWIADWYNFIIQHNPNPTDNPVAGQGKTFGRGQGNAYVTPMRDLERGRIYKVVYKNAKAYAPLTLSRNNIPGLVSALENDNMFWRKTAQRLLVESKNLSALPGIYAIANNQKVDEIGLNSPAVHALWTLHGLGVLKGTNAEAMQVAIKALSHPAAGVRKTAIEVLPRTRQGSDAIIKAGLLSDADLNVRMIALVALSEMPASDEVGRLLYTSSVDSRNLNDDWLAKALYAAANTHANGFLAAAPKNQDFAVGTTLTLTQRIVKGLTEPEVYTLANRQGSIRAASFTPDVTGKEIVIKATLTRGAPVILPPVGQGNPPPPAVAPPLPAQWQGLIVAQGEKDNAYGLYIRDGKLNMVVKQNGQSYVATSSAPLPESFTVLARLAANGTMTIEVDGKQVATGKAPSLFTKPMSLGLRSQADLQSPTEDRISDGAYVYNGVNQVTFPLTGAMLNATLELKKLVK